MKLSPEVYTVITLFTLFIAALISFLGYHYFNIGTDEEVESWKEHLRKHNLMK